MSKLRILLVDDQKLVLLGLERLLRRMRGLWETTVADSGRQACALMEAQPFDVLVTDLNMPGFSGAQLLEWVMENRPSMVRIVLSGHQDRELIESATRTAHRFLTKPCDPGALEGVLTSVSLLLDLPTDYPNLRRAVACTACLPSSPATRRRFLACMHQEEPREALQPLFLEDPGLAASALQLVNSSFFGSPRTLVNPWEAVQILTGEELATLVPPTASQDQEARLLPIREAALRIAHGALAITLVEGAPAPVQDLAYMAGLLSSAGPMVLALTLPEVAPETVDLPALSRQFLNLLGLPQPLLEIVGAHRAPARASFPASLALAAVHVASGTPDESFLSNSGWLVRLPGWLNLTFPWKDAP